MSELDNIRLHEGIAEVRFGASKDDVVESLGTKFEEEIDEFGDMNMSYPDLQIDFTFWEDFDYRLGYIETERKSTRILGKKIMGLHKNDLKKFVENTLDCSITEEDGCEHENGDIQEWIDVDEKGLTFWFMNEILYQISWMCAWVDGDTPDWPTVRHHTERGT